MSQKGLPTLVASLSHQIGQEGNAGLRFFASTRRVVKKGYRFLTPVSNLKPLRGATWLCDNDLAGKDPSGPINQARGQDEVWEQMFLTQGDLQPAQFQLWIQNGPSSQH